MPNDNVRLAIWITGLWGAAIIVIIGAEAIVHDGTLAATIVDSLSKALGALVVIIGTVAGVAKVMEAKQATAAAANTNGGGIAASLPAQVLPAQVLVGSASGAAAPPTQPVTSNGTPPALVPFPVPASATPPAAQS